MTGEWDTLEVDDDAAEVGTVRSDGVEGRAPEGSDGEALGPAGGLPVGVCKAAERRFCENVIKM